MHLCGKVVAAEEDGTIEPDQIELWPRLTARRENAPLASMSALRVLPMARDRRAAMRYFALKGLRPSIRVAAEVSHQQRVAVKVRTVVHGPSPRAGLMAHVRYIERDSSGREGEDVRLFNAGDRPVDGQAFAYHCQDDRRHYRLTINPERGDELPDLEAFCRRLMKEVEKDLGTSIEWIGGVHHDTGRPHAHVVWRGTDSAGRVLKPPHDYLSHGLRARAEAMATDVLGQRAERAQDHLIRLDRFTRLDRVILDASASGQLDESKLPALARDDALRRLSHLEARGWASKQGLGLWSVRHDLRATLHRVKETGMRERAAAAIVQHSGLKVATADIVPVDLEAGETIVGGYIGCKFIGPYAGGAHVVVLDLADGRLGQIRMPDAASVICLDRIPQGAPIEVRGVERQSRAADGTIAEVAAENGGTWSPEIHASTRPDDHTGYIMRHAKRVAAMARDGVCSSMGNGQYAIPKDYVVDAANTDTLRWGRRVPDLRILDHRSLDTQVSAAGITWLDRQIAGQTGVDQHAGRFGTAIKTAVEARRSELVKLGVMNRPADVLSPEAVHELNVTSVRLTFEALGADGKPVLLAKSGHQVSGLYRGRVFMCGQACAVIDGSGSITLAPWKPALEAVRGQAIVGQVSDYGLDFRSSRITQRGLELG